MHFSCIIVSTHCFSILFFRNLILTECQTKKVSVCCKIFAFFKAIAIVRVRNATLCLLLRLTYLFLHHCTHFAKRNEEMVVGH